MDEAPIVGGPADGEAQTGRTGTNGDPSWSSRMSELRTTASDGGAFGVADGPAALPGGEDDGLLEAGMERLRQDACQFALDDAAHNRPSPDAESVTEQEDLLRERCRSLFERWTLAQRRRIGDLLVDCEEQASRFLGRTELLLDRFERLTNQIIRLKARRSTRRQELESRPDNERERRSPELSTKVYLLAISFLGVVEFFANAPVFTALLPRDARTERQIAVIAETSTSWMAGVQRVLAQLVLRPDAALLAAGVITFLLVLAHFFGHSLRALVMREGPQVRRGAGSSRAGLENAVPMLLSGVGLVLALGVLFQARVVLGEVGEYRYDQDMEVVSELRRSAGWLQTDGELLQASQLTDQAADMEAVALRLREYAASMNRMTVPILLLNITLILAAITAAYSHRRAAIVGDREEEIFDDSREGITETAESTASEISDILSRARRPIRELHSLSEDGYSCDPGGVARRLESIITLYRRQNMLTRGLTQESVAAFRAPAMLGLSADLSDYSLDSFRRVAAEAETEHRKLGDRFRETRERFSAEINSWEPGSGNPSGPGSRLSKTTLAALVCALLAGTTVGCGRSTATAEDRDPPPELAIFVYDRSGSILDYQLELASDLTGKRVRQLDHGDRIVAMELLEASLDEPPQRWSQSVPEREYPDMEVESDSLTRDRFLRDAAAYMKRFTDTGSRKPTRGTDILSTLHDVAADLRAHREYRATLYLFSDMLQANSSLNFEGLRHTPPAGWIERAAEEGRFPDLKGLCVVVVGVRIETERSQAVKDFWLRYFEVTGATLYSRNYTLRPVDLPEAPCGS